MTFNIREADKLAEAFEDITGVPFYDEPMEEELVIEEADEEAPEDETE